MTAELFAIRIPPDPTPQELDGWLKHVDEDFRTKVKRFRLIRDSLRSLGGRLAVLWYLLSFGIVGSPKEASFGTGPKGKPLLISPVFNPTFEYNVSHDNDYVLLGVQRAGRIGVDLMAISHDPEHVELVTEALTDQMTIRERRAMAGFNPSRDRIHALTTIWCVKEAYVKAIGEGVGFGLERIEVILDNNADVQSVSVDALDNEASGWALDSGYLDEGAYRWVCIHEGHRSENTGSVRPTSLRWEDMVSVLSRVEREL